VKNKAKLFKARITIRITQEMLEEIESIAKKKRLTKSEAVRRLLQKVLEKEV